MHKRTEVSRALAMALSGLLGAGALPVAAQQGQPEPAAPPAEQAASAPVAPAASAPAQPPAASAPAAAASAVAPVPAPAASEPVPVPPAPEASAPVTRSTKLERVEITGSRIISPNAEAAAPVQVISAAQIATSGATNVQQLLLQNPTVGEPTVSRTNSAFLTASAGVSTVDLRNLGTARTLVLVNGRRYVSGIPGDSAVDLNTIPTEFVERIEILSGGASAAYGSDAMAGVVNIILRRDFQGLAFTAHAGTSDRGDDDTKRFGVTFGATGDGGRGSLITHIGYSTQGGVNSRDRAFSAIDQQSLALTTGDPADFFTPQRPFFSSFTPAGTFTAGGTRTTFDRQGNEIPVDVNGDNGPPTGFNRSDFRTIAVPTDRLLFASKGDYALTDQHSLYYEGTYAATHTETAIEPFALRSSDIYKGTGGRVPVEFPVNGVLVRNPLVPDSIFNRSTDTDADGARDFTFTRRLSEVGTRGNVADRDTYRFVLGAKGTVLSNWDYDLYGISGATKEAQTSSGQVNVLNFRNALEAIPDGNGGAVCRDPNAVAQGCVPINVFGFDSISPAALKYVTAPGSLSTLTKQGLVGGSISGEPMQLSAGPLGLAVGFEYRDEYSRTEYDALTQTGLNGGNALPNTEGGFDVKELFAEARVPLLKDKELVKALTATLGLRGGKYSTVGDVLSWNSGVEWVANRTFKVRASRALSTRAPNIGELFQAPAQTFPTGLNDPCEGVTATTNSDLAQRCRADPGVAANIAANGSFTLNQADTQGVSGFDSGNPALSEEKGKSWTLGLVVTPESMKSIAVTVDYFHIRIQNAILLTDRQFILDQCYSGDASFCQFVTRRTEDVGPNSAGSLEFINATERNSAELGTSGVDVTVAYRRNIGEGLLNAQLTYTYLQDGYQTPTADAPQDPFAGEIGAPKHKASLSLGYKWRDFGFYGTTTYISASALDDQFLAAFDLPPNSIKTPRKIYQDIQVTYRPVKAAELYFGIDNLFDTQPAPIISGLPGDDTGTETNAGTYDPIGRRYYAGVRVNF